MVVHRAGVPVEEHIEHLALAALRPQPELTVNRWAGRRHTCLCPQLMAAFPIDA
jgi:hypothetical protein